MEIRAFLELFEDLLSLACRAITIDAFNVFGREALA
jgi:hypothetical protein